MAPLDDFSDARMQFSPALVRETLVGRVTDERMPEPERPGDIRIALDEFAEPAPCLRACRDERVVLEDVGDQRRRERDTEHRRPAKQRPISGRELVDSGRNQ